MPVPPFFFFFNDTATTEIYTLSLHDALPILVLLPLILYMAAFGLSFSTLFVGMGSGLELGGAVLRSEEHTSELQSHLNLVCRLLLEKKKDEIVITATLSRCCHPLLVRE